MWIDSQEREVKTILVANPQELPELARQLTGEKRRRERRPLRPAPKFQLRCSSPRTKLMVTEALEQPRRGPANAFPKRWLFDAA